MMTTFRTALRTATLMILVLASAGLAALKAGARPRHPAEESDADDGNGGSVLTQVASRLASQVTLLPDGVFPAVPSDWNRTRIATVLTKIRLRPTEKRVKNHRSLMFDHDVKAQTIVALEPFFVLYGLIPSGRDLSRDQLRDLDRKLLLEVAALWKAQPPAADKFADAMLSLFDRNVIFCRGEVKMSSPIEYHFVVNPSWLEGGVLVTSANLAITSDTPSYREMQDHGVNSELYRSVISRGLGDNSVIGIDKGPHQIKVNFRLTKINYDPENGKGEFVDIDNVAHAIECHNLLVDSELEKEGSRNPQNKSATVKASPTPASSPPPVASPSPKPVGPAGEVSKPPSM